MSVMYSTGPLFLSVIWIKYLWALGRGGDGEGGIDRVRVLLRVEGEEEADSYGFFKNVAGGSWHGGDVDMVFWMEKHWVIVTLMGFLGGFLVVGIAWSVFRFVGGRMSRRREGERERARGSYGLVLPT